MALPEAALALRGADNAHRRARGQGASRGAAVNEAEIPDARGRPDERDLDGRGGRGAHPHRRRARGRAPGLRLPALRGRFPPPAGGSRGRGRGPG